MNYGTIKTRYRVEGERIAPLSYKTDGGIQAMTDLLPAYLVCLLIAFLVARRVARRASLPVAAAGPPPGV